MALTPKIPVTATTYLYDPCELRSQEEVPQFTTDIFFSFSFRTGDAGLQASNSSALVTIDDEEEELDCSQPLHGSTNKIVQEQSSSSPPPPHKKNAQASPATELVVPGMDESNQMKLNRSREIAADSSLKRRGKKGKFCVLLCKETSFA